MNETTLNNSVEHPNSIATQPITAEFSDSRTLIILRDFLQAAKPAGIKPPEVAFVSILLTFKAIDHPVRFSHTTLAAMLGCDEDTVSRTEKTLKAKGWISTVSRKGLSKLTSVNLDKLPMADRTLPIKPSDAAIELSKRYLRARFKRRLKPLHKKQLATLDWNAQKIINRCDGNADIAFQMIEHALGHAEHSKAAKHSLYALIKRWHSVEKTWRGDVFANIEIDESMFCNEVDNTETTGERKR